MSYFVGNIFVFGKNSNLLIYSLKHITDTKPITARQCIKQLPVIAKYRPELRDDILSALHKADISVYEDSMQPLIYKDIQKAIKEILRF